ncbi:arginine deiminase family protein [Corynebacterium kefirresidentii]
MTKKQRAAAIDIVAIGSDELGRGRDCGHCMTCSISATRWSVRK